MFYLFPVISNVILSRFIAFYRYFIVILARFISILSFIQGDGQSSAKNRRRPRYMRVSHVKTVELDQNFKKKS